MIIKSDFIQSLGAIFALISYVGVIILRIIVIFFKMWNLCISMGKSISRTSAIIVLSFLIPVGDLIFSLILLNRSKSIIQLFENQERLLVISDVLENSKAKQYGIKAEDIILRICEKKIETIDELKKLLQNRDKTQLVKIDLVRKGKLINIGINLGDDEKLGVNF
jgi:S1-C subfamily serine protease